MTIHRFNCRECKQKFSFESEHADIKKFKESLKRGVRCPQCDKEWGDPKANIVHDFEPAVSAEDLRKRDLRKENAERSREASAMAADYARRDAQEERVTINPPKGEKGQPIQIKKSTLDSIEQKMQTVVDEA